MMYGFWGMECNGQNFLLFFALFPLLITQKLKFWKTEKETSRYYHFTHVYHKWKSYDVWFLRYEAWLTESFVIVDHFLPFYPPTNPKIKILKNWRKGLQILSFYTCVPCMTIIGCMVTEIKSMTNRIFCHFGPFFALLAPL